MIPFPNNRRDKVSLFVGIVTTVVLIAVDEVRKVVRKMR